MNNESIVNNDIFECKMYITDLETNKDSKEIDVSDLVFKDWLEFEFGNYEEDDYTQLPYKDFKFFINDYSVTFYSPQYHKAIKEIERLNNIADKYKNVIDKIKEYCKKETIDNREYRDVAYRDALNNILELLEEVE